MNSPARWVPDEPFVIDGGTSGRPRTVVPAWLLPRALELLTEIGIEPVGTGQTCGGEIDGQRYSFCGIVFEQNVRLDDVRQVLDRLHAWARAEMQREREAG